MGVGEGMKKVLLFLSLCLVPVLASAQTVVIKANDSATGIASDVGDATNEALRVNVVAGAAAGPSDTDDGSVAGGQSAGLNIAQSHVWDGSVWRRFTIGTAGTPSAQVLTVQGITSGTAITISGNLTNISGTISLPTGAATAAKQPALGTAGSASVDVITVQGIASGTNLNITCSNCSGSGVSVLEDAASANADAGTPAYGIQKATPANTAADGDYTPLQLSAGRLWVDPSGVTLTVGAHNVTNAGTFAVQSAQSGTWTTVGGKTNNNAAPGATNHGVFGCVANAAAPSWTETFLVGCSTDLHGSERVTLLKSDGTAATLATDVTEDAGETAGGTGPFIMGVRRDAAASSAGTTGDNASFNTDALGLMWTRLLDPCSGVDKTTTAISLTADTVIIAATASKKNYICTLVVVAGAAEIVSITEGTGSTCATSEAALVGSTTDANGMSFAANGGLSLPGGNATAIKGISTNVDTCLNVSGSNRVSGFVTWVQAP